MKKLIIGLAALAALAFVAVAAAAPWWQTHSFSGPSYVGSDAYFDVHRTVPGDNDPVVWVSNRCFDGSGQATYSGLGRYDRAVQWGTWDSLDGVAGPFSIPVDSVTCTAYLTVTPWNVKNNDPSITYAVP